LLPNNTARGRTKAGLTESPGFGDRNLVCTRPPMANDMQAAE
jgi:hypothetical protein